MPGSNKKQKTGQKLIGVNTFKVFHWQFIPDIDLETSSHHLEHAYKLFAPAEYPEAKKQISDDPSFWHKIDGTCYLEEVYVKDPCIKPLLKFRKIVESKESNEKQIAKINQLFAKHKEVLIPFFDSKSSLSPGDQWFATKLKEDGLPLAFELYKEGYTTAEKCLEINCADFAKRKGVGPKKSEQLAQYQAKVRRRINMLSGLKDNEI